MSRVVVTGSAGFVGSHVARALVERGEDVLCVDNLSGGDNRVEGARFVKIDLAYDDLSRIALFRPELVFHAAAVAREGASWLQPVTIVANGVWASTRLFETCILGGALKRIVFCSSMARYGEGSPPFDETHVPTPCDLYGAGKLDTEHVLHDLAEVHGFSYSIAIPHNVAGGSGQCLRDRFRNVASITANRIMRNEPIIVFGDGKQQRAFSPIEDALPCFIRMIDGAADSLRVNVGGKYPITVLELVNAIREDFGVPDHPITFLPARHGEVRYAWSTTKRSEELLGYVENVGWRQSIRNMVAWAKTKGPQEWSQETLTLLTSNMPVVWR